MDVLEMRQRIKEARKITGMSQEYAAQALGVSIERYRKWEQRASKVSAPPIEFLVKIGELFGVGMDELILGESAPIAAKYCDGILSLTGQELDLILKYRVVDGKKKKIIQEAIMTAYVSERISKKK